MIRLAIARQSPWHINGYNSCLLWTAQLHVCLAHAGIVSGSETDCIRLDKLFIFAIHCRHCHYHFFCLLLIIFFSFFLFLPSTFSLFFSLFFSIFSFVPLHEQFSNCFSSFHSFLLPQFSSLFVFLFTCCIQFLHFLGFSIFSSIFLLLKTFCLIKLNKHILSC